MFAKIVYYMQTSLEGYFHRRLVLVVSQSMRQRDEGLLTNSVPSYSGCNQDDPLTVADCLYVLRNPGRKGSRINFYKIEI